MAQIDRSEGIMENGRAGYPRTDDKRNEVTEAVRGTKMHKYWGTQDRSLSSSPIQKEYRLRLSAGQETGHSVVLQARIYTLHYPAVS